jgi:hypothetical protein
MARFQVSETCLHVAGQLLSDENQPDAFGDKFTFIAESAFRNESLDIGTKIGWYLNVHRLYCSTWPKAIFTVAWGSTLVVTHVFDFPSGSSRREYN